MTSRPETEGINAVQAAELAFLSREVQGRAIALYLADPALFDFLKGVLEAASAQIDRRRSQLPDDYRCPYGTVPCERGCCFPEERTR